MTLRPCRPLLLLLLPACAAPPPLQLTLHNPLNQDRPAATVVVTRAQLDPYLPDARWPVARADGRPLPGQWDDLDGDGRWDEWALRVEVAAGATRHLEVSFTADTAGQSSFPAATHVHFGRKLTATTPARPRQRDVLRRDTLGWQQPFYPYQMDGPAWENDLVGYRLYFDGRFIKDVFGKQQPGVVLPTVGLTADGTPQDNYHVLEDWGRDVLSVGSSLGAGGLAVRVAGRPYRVGVRQGATRGACDSTTFRLIANGPVRSLFAVSYQGCDAGPRRFDVEEIIQIAAGNHYFTSQVRTRGGQAGDALLVGLVTKDNRLPVVFTDTAQTLVSLATHDQQSYERAYWLGLALIGQKQGLAGVDTLTAADGFDPTVVLAYPLSDTATVRYRVWSGWERQDATFTDRTATLRQLASEVTTLDHPLVVRLETR